MKGKGNRIISEEIMGGRDMCKEHNGSGISQIE